ncbi:hypothetical protein MKW94_010926 [Papaver nudicaule]|uniref:Uncharacterized protein n=1 Tax=Papaver nudicaule TaxID=74823 RepID=A0AA42AR17_PAPNU|nr:hypothetical protein [Papaver nudicaule]
MEKLGLDNEKIAGDYPHHLQRFRKKIQVLRKAVIETEIFAELAKMLENLGLGSCIGIMVISLICTQREKVLTQKMRVTLGQLLRTRLLCV